jgi:hypothetical protein
MHHYRRRGGERAPEPQLTEATIATPFDLAKAARAAVQARDLKALERLLQRPEAAEMDDRRCVVVSCTSLRWGRASLPAGVGQPPTNRLLSLLLLPVPPPTTPNHDARCSAAFVVRTAVEQHSASALGLLFAQPAVLGMGARAIAGLLQTAIRYKNVPAVLQLSKLEAAHDISPGYISYLLGEATTLGHAGVIQSLSMLQGHQTGAHLDRAHVVGGCWGWATHSKGHTSLAAASFTRAAELEQLVPAGSIEGALRTAVLQGRRQMVFHMTESEGVLGLQPTAIAGILSTAVQHCRCVDACALCVGGKGAHVSAP